MPLYEYQCQGCSARQEVIQRFSDAPLTECADCGGELRKLISSPAIQFKGSGFYITDYSRSSGSSSSETRTETPASSGTESKPAASDSAPSGTAATTGAASTTPTT